jgi:hypothetical protein
MFRQTQPCFRCRPLRQAVATCAFALGLLLGAVSAPALAGDLRASVDRRQVQEGDTVTLNIEMAGIGASGSPDLSPLKQDFDVLETSSGTQIRIVNGSRSDTTSWRVTLAPKRTGVLTIPAISLGPDSTPPLTLTVSPAPQGATSGMGDDIFVELEVGEGGQAQTEGVLVQQQVPLTVRLYTARPLIGGDLSEPRVDDAVIAKLGEDLQYQTQRQGRDYQVVERRYSLSPEKSGELRIPPVVFKGSVRAPQAQGQRRGIGGPFDDLGLDRFFQAPDLDRFFGNAFGRSDPFGMFERGEPVRAQSNGVDLKVRARPEGLDGAQWLPAQGLTITDSWGQNPPQLRVGEPVTRTLTLTAKGLVGAQVPEVGLPAVDGLRIYPEKTEAETRTDGETVFGVSRQTYTIIPSRAGALTIPEIRVPWWDTGSQREQVATLPAWSLHAEGAGQTEAPRQAPLDPDVGGALAQAPDHAAQGADAAPGTSAPAGDDATSAYLRPKFLAGAALVLLGIATAAILWRRRRRAPSISPGAPMRAQAAGLSGEGRPARQADGPASVKRSLREACASNDPKAAAKALLRWAQAVWPDDPPRGLGALAVRITPAAVEPLKALESRLYAPSGPTWNGSPLWEAVQDGLAPRARREAEVTEDLAPLYPARG